MENKGEIEIEYSDKCFDFDVDIPCNIKIIEEKGYYRIIAEADIQKDDVIYVSDLNLINDEQEQIEFILNGKKSSMKTYNHTFLGNGKTYFTSFDCFLNHSCDPNTVFEIKNNKCVVSAKKDIKKGDELFSDYTEDLLQF